MLLVLRASGKKSTLLLGSKSFQMYQLKKPTFSQMRKVKYGCGEQRKVAAPVHSTTFTSKQCVKAIFCQKNNYWWWCTISQTHKNSNLHSLKGRRFQNTSLLCLAGSVNAGAAAEELKFLLANYCHHVDS